MRSLIYSIIQKKIADVLLLMLLGLSLSACEYGWRPIPLPMSHAPKGEPLYEEGWNDGCQTGLAALGNTFYKTFYKFKQKVYYVDNPLYFGAWWDAYNYCKDYADKWTFDAIDVATNIDPNREEPAGLGDLFKGNMFAEAPDPYLIRNDRLPFSF